MDTHCSSLQLSWLFIFAIWTRLRLGPRWPTWTIAVQSKPGCVQAPLYWTQFCTSEFTILSWKDFWCSIFLLALGPKALNLTWHTPNHHLMEGVKRQVSLSVSGHRPWYYPIVTPLSKTDNININIKYSNRLFEEVLPKHIYQIRLRYPEGNKVLRQWFLIVTVPKALWKLMMFLRGVTGRDIWH